MKGRGALHHNNVTLNIANGPTGRVVGAGAGKRWDYYGEDTGIRFGTGPGRINFGAHYFQIGEEFEDNIEVAFWFHPEDDPPETEANVEIHHRWINLIRVSLEAGTSSSRPTGPRPCIGPGCWISRS